jgi:uncharacterized SAM-binding protein YcdF (DUF218 family)
MHFEARVFVIGGSRISQIPSLIPSWRAIARLRRDLDRPQDQVPKARFRRAAIGLALAAIAIGAGWVERGPLLQNIAAGWVVSEELAHADAVVVLGGGIDVRPFAAAALYKRGLADTVLVSNARKGRAERLGFIPTHTELNRDVLIKLGVPATAIGDFGENLSSTEEEAGALRAWAAQRQAKSIIVPTELFAGRRVRWIFERELAPVGVHVIVHTYEPADYTLADWWRHRSGLIDFNNEVLKYLYYRARY